MLTDPDRLLIAAAADGTATPAEAVAVARLLAGSAAARTFAARLAADRRRLGALPRLAAPAEFADRVEAALPIIRPRPSAPARRWPGWAPYAVAAGVFLAVGVGSFEFGRHTSRPAPVAAKGASRPAPSATVPTPPERLPFPRPAALPETEPVAVAPAPTESAPHPRAVPTPVVSAAGLLAEVPSPAEVSVRLPVLGPVAGFAGPDAAARVEGELAALAPARLDLFAPDVAAATQALQAVGQGVGLTVAVDEGVRERLKGRAAGLVALYTESLTPLDVGRLLAALANRDRAGPPLGHAHLTAAGPADLRDLKELFGEPRSARDRGDGSTIGQVLKQVGRPSKAGRPAVVFAWGGPAGKQVRAFADARGERKPGTLPLLALVRSAEAP